MNLGKIMVLGGDGFCGWPTSLYLSSQGYDVTIVDNYSRRDIDKDLGTNSLTPIFDLLYRIHIWDQITGQRIKVYQLDLAKEYYPFVSLLKKIKPDAIVHFAEQRAAPFSMRTEWTKRYTVENNIRTTHNVLCGLVDAKIDAHVVHLGTMGVYGYGKAEMNLPEGYIDCFLVDPVTRENILTHIYYPTSPGSIYHMSKVLDTHLFAYYRANDGIRITDLHQGIVWGINTPQTVMHPALVNRFDYDGDYGTCLNRWLVQAAIGHPLTVYGIGEQTRAFINIRDTVQCIRYAIENPPDSNNPDVRVWNQTTQQLRLIDIAHRIKSITGCEIRLYKNPRAEAPKNKLRACSTNIREQGLQPLLLNDQALVEIYELAKLCSDNVKRDKIVCTSVWRQDLSVDYQGTPYEP